MYQKVEVIGNLGGDPTLRHTPQGSPVCNLRLASTRRWNGSDDTPVEETTWFDVTVWGRQAEACNTYLSKGRLVLVVGRLKPHPDTGGPKVWTDKEGKARASFELVAREVIFLPGGSNNNGQDSDQEKEIEEETEAEIPF
jgi:single-strand DNA-binding protein